MKSALQHIAFWLVVILFFAWLAAPGHAQQLPVVNHNGTPMYAPDKPFESINILSCNGTGCGGASTVDTRPLRTTTVKPSSANLPAGGTITLSSIASGPGTLVAIHISEFGAVISGNNAVGCNSAQTSLLNFTPTGGATQSVPFQTFLGTYGWPTAFAEGSGRFEVSGTSPLGGQPFGVSRVMDVNFANGFTITITDGDPTTGTGTPCGSKTVYFDATYRIGAQVDPAWRTVWHTYTTTATTSGTYALLPTQAIAGGGELESIFLNVNPTDNSDYAYLETQPAVYADSSLAVTANGTEDFFGNSFYCEVATGIGGARNDKWGCSIGTQLQITYQGAYMVNLYRFFDNRGADRLFFNSTLSASWPNTEAVTAYSTVTFWGAN
jgi:hypothetical protein